MAPRQAVSPEVRRCDYYDAESARWDALTLTLTLTRTLTLALALSPSPSLTLTLTLTMILTPQSTSKKCDTCQEYAGIFYQKAC